MTTPGQPEPPERSEREVRFRRAERRREKIYRDIQRDRAGNHRIPTWVLAAVLALILAGWVYLIITS
ncbi:hypothetical protein GCM10010112_29250 [Actinoplanes lobatus]|uniref:Uncharacterized protein n=1 Tax=Actinoplanes lobatus TaxID=113568 RepID=A0A7W7MM03_9ACTN|nr:hypothetical protein [Actinoplanes lobatus]MBB4754635.1 hypothetical protein [Actinoplanes lobatus]GGN66656.1 hypothetical protein GCM10010112_29250 [Actinoplanes lobatus]GIE42513.1 hypothetical protein Alo02nite_54110 [Actinoplanes lobatus]